MGDVVLVLGTGGAGGDATASGCCWSQGEHGRVRAGRLVATGGALGVLQHHTQSNLPYSLLLRSCVLCVVPQVAGHPPTPTWHLSPPPGHVPWSRGARMRSWSTCSWRLRQEHDEHGQAKAVD